METVCSSVNGMQYAKSETLVDGVADFRHVFIYSEHEITLIKLFVELESFWFCNLLLVLEVSKTIVPKINMPTLHPLWQTYHASLAMAFIASWNRVARNTLHPSMAVLGYTFIKCTSLPVYAVLYQKQWIQAYSLWGIYIGQCLFTQNALCWCWLPSETRLALSQLVHHCALILPSLFLNGSC